MCLFVFHKSLVLNSLIFHLLPTFLKHYNLRTRIHQHIINFIIMQSYYMNIQPILFHQINIWCLFWKCLMPQIYMAEIKCCTSSHFVLRKMFFLCIIIFKIKIKQINGKMILLQLERISTMKTYCQSHALFLQKYTRKTWWSNWSFGVETISS